MKKLLILIQQDPYTNQSVSEGIDLAFAAATYDVEVALVFVNKGLVCLTEGQKPAEIKRRSVEKKINSLPMYGVEHLYALVPTPNIYNFPLSDDIMAIDQNQLKQLYADYDEIQVF